MQLKGSFMTSAPTPKKDDAVLPAAATVEVNKKEEADKTPPASSDKK